MQSQQPQVGFFELWLLAIVSFLILTLGAKTSAEESKSTAKNQIEKTTDWVYSGSILIETSSTINLAEEISQSGLYRWTNAISHTPSSTSTSLRMGYSQNYSYVKDAPEYGRDDSGDFEDPLLKLTKTFSEVGILTSVSTGLSGRVALSKLSRQRDFIASIGPSVSYSKKLGDFTWGQGLSYLYGFYEFEERRNGSINSPHQISLSNSLSYDLGKGWSSSAAFVYVYAISFQNVARGLTFSDLSLSKQVTNSFSLTLGAATQAGVLDSAGAEYNVNLFDPGISEAYLDLVISL